jgi:hypothetical protein
MCEYEKGDAGSGGDLSSFGRAGVIAFQVCCYLL